MTPPRLEACYFDPGPKDRWGRMARALALTAAEHCPTWTRTIAAATPPPRVSALRIESHVQNTRKMDEWQRIVMAAAPGDRILLIDADTLILRPLDDVWDQPFDLAYTAKGRDSRYPFNSGVVFLRISPAVQAFVAAWWQENLKMLGQAKYHQDWRVKFGGINQASLGAMLESGRSSGVTLLKLPCLEWNCEDSHWEKFDPLVTRIVHVKSALRKAIFDGGPVPAGCAPLVRAWRTADARADLERQRATAMAG